MKPTYNEQWNKLTSAYVNNKVFPLLECACFVGNLLNGKSGWGLCRNLEWDIACRLTGRVSLDTSEDDYVKEGLNCIYQNSEGLYSPEDIIALEEMFLTTYRKYGGNMELCNVVVENALFKAFEVTLELLKKIHISKGEVIDAVPEFKMRELVLINN